VTSEEEQIQTAVRPFVRYILARIAIFGTESQQSWPIMQLATGEQLLREDWERLVTLKDL
jgi:hypothetical protein